MLKKFSKQEKSWIMYDWANSVQATIIAAVILPVYFTGIAQAEGLSATQASSYWGYATSIGSLLVAVFAPVLGGLMNVKNWKMRIFSCFFTIGIIGTAALFFSFSWQFLLTCYALSVVGFAGSNLCYDSFLIDITPKDRMETVSTYGFAMGYIGGSTIPFIISILLLTFCEKIGIDKSMAARISFLIAACWWLVFSIPFIKNVKQTYFINREKGIVKQTFSNLWDTMRHILRFKHIALFLLAYFFYIDGVNTIIHMATIYGDSVGIDTNTMIIIMLVIQIVAFPATILFGRLTKRFGSSKMILTAIVIYMLICLVGFTMRSAWQFWLLGILVASVQGGIQAISRAYFSKMLPLEKANEFFGFYEIFGRFAAILGPFLFGITSQLSGSTSIGVLSIMSLFIIGGGVFLFARRLCDPYQQQ